MNIDEFAISRNNINMMCKRITIHGQLLSTEVKT